MSPIIADFFFWGGAWRRDFFYPQMSQIHADFFFWGGLFLRGGAANVFYPQIAPIIADFFFWGRLAPGLFLSADYADSRRFLFLGGAFLTRRRSQCFLSADCADYRRFLVLPGFTKLGAFGSIERDGTGACPLY
jgi:hypothetical protein